MTNSSSESALVSVIIPTYNRPNYLKQAVASVINQTYKNIEVIVCDDCSPEHPQEMLDSFQDSRLKLLRHPQNLGNGPNVTEGFRLAQGKYVASLNDDDLWEPDFLAKLVPPLEENPHLSAAFCDHSIIDASGQIDQIATQKSSRQWSRDQLKEGIYQPFYQLALIDQSVSPASAAVLRREVINTDELAQVGVYWDHYLAYLACRQGYGAYYCPQQLTRYRVHDQSETSMSGRKNAGAKIRKGRSGLFCYSQFLADPRLQNYQTHFQAQLVEAITTLGIGLIRDGQAKVARPYLIKALRQSINPRTVAAFLISLLPNSAAQWAANR